MIRKIYVIDNSLSEKINVVVNKEEKNDRN